jgi:hypothetical protein
MFTVVIFNYSYIHMHVCIHTHVCVCVYTVIFKQICINSPFFYEDIQFCVYVCI